MIYLKIEDDKFSVMDDNTELLSLLITTLYTKYESAAQKELQRFAQEAAQIILQSQELCIIEKLTCSRKINRFKKTPYCKEIFTQIAPKGQEILLKKIDVGKVNPIIQCILFENINAKITTGENTPLEIIALPIAIEKINKSLLPNFNLTVKTLDLENSICIERICNQKYSINLLCIEALYWTQHNIEHILISKRSHHALKIEFSHQSCKNVYAIINVAKKLLVPSGISIKSADYKQFYSLEKAMTENAWFEKLADQGISGILSFIKTYPSKQDDVQYFFNNYWKYYDGLIKDFCQATPEHQEAFIDFFQEGNFRKFCCSIRKLLAVFTPEHLNTMVEKSLNQYSYDRGRFDNETKQLIKNELSPVLKKLEENLTKNKNIDEDLSIISQQLLNISAELDDKESVIKKQMLSQRIGRIIFNQYSIKEFNDVFKKTLRNNIKDKLYNEILNNQSRFIYSDCDQLSNFIAQTIKSTIEESIEPSFSNKKKRDKIKKLAFKALALSQETIDDISDAEGIFCCKVANTDKTLGLKKIIDMFPHLKDFMVQYLETNGLKRGFLLLQFLTNIKEHQDYLIDLLPNESNAKKSLMLLNKALILDVFAIPFLQEEIKKFTKKNQSNDNLDQFYINDIVESIFLGYSNFFNKNLNLTLTSPILKNILNLSSPDAAKVHDAKIALQQNIKSLFETQHVFSKSHEKNIQDNIFKSIIYNRDQITTSEQVRNIIIQAIELSVLKIKKEWQNIDQQKLYRDQVEIQPQDDIFDCIKHLDDNYKAEKPIMGGITETNSTY